MCIGLVPQMFLSAPPSKAPAFRILGVSNSPIERVRVRHHPSKGRNPLQTSLEPTISCESRTAVPLS